MNHDFLPVHLIQTFVAFVEAANITEAAGKIGLSQPAVSVHLKKLEEVLPRPPFETIGKRKVLTAYGKALYQALAPTYHQMQSQFQMANTYFLEKDKIRFKVAGPRKLLSRLAVHFEFKSQLHFIEMDEELAWSKLQSHEVDFALGSSSAKNNEAIATKSIQSFIEVQVHESLVSSDNWWRDPEWLKSNDLLSYESPSEEVLDYFEFVEAQAPTPRVVFPDWLTLKSLVHQKKGYLIGPDTPSFSDKKIVSKKISNRRAAHLIYQKSLEGLFSVNSLFNT